MNRLPVENTNGITVGQLKKWLNNFPDDGEVWASTQQGLSSQAKQLTELGDCSVCISYDLFGDLFGGKKGEGK